MSDTRPRVPRPAELNLLELDAELGGHGLCASDTEIVVADDSPVTQTELEAAVVAHVPVATTPSENPVAVMRAQLDDLLDRLGKATTLAAVRDAAREVVKIKVPKGG